MAVVVEDDTHVMMQNIIDVAGKLCASEEKITKLFLEVRRSNEVAQNLYQQWQFSVLSVRKGYYRAADKRREDALVMMRKLN